MPKLSIVVPVFKMSGNLSRLETWIRDSRRDSSNVEIIVVEDGGDVDTLSELKALKDKYGFNLLTGAYSSPGLARNEGLRVAQGHWITFWDSDDFGYPAKVLENIEDCPIGVEVVIGNYRTIDITRNHTMINRVDFQLAKLVTNLGLWRMVFRRESLAGKSFSASKMGEDQVFFASLKFRDQDCKFSESIFYDYHTGNPRQLTSDKSAILEIESSIKNLIRILQSHHQRPSEYQLVIFFNMLLTAIKNHAFSPYFAFKIFFNTCKRTRVPRVTALQTVSSTAMRVFLRRVRR